MPNFRPLGANVLVKPLEPVTETPGGIVLPFQAQVTQKEGTVVAIGPGIVTQKGVTVPTVVKVGETVIYGFGGNELTFDGQKYLLFQETELLGIKNG